MDQHQKAMAFDYIMLGKVTGMATFWSKIQELSGIPNNEVLEKMAKFAAMEAMEIVLDITYPEKGEN